eukprot:CAMPEP_0202452480 /NCGR_PEP_ID=MMETSP1360-20130828/10686_1 /ASSEMBLY_ACC=CAM_ASM_000848 /TAXON_ID=515479 /ORGANISM="Licmophora paradoxa, Strain CCMP2313" /LENGTH=711 /DNA_ID=CAMNT_0049071317 /DNA_START=6 /DNA_END=2141 /DNA_ORIENTATION=+
MRVCEGSGGSELKFPVRHISVRGGLLFYFDIEDVEDHTNGHFVSYQAPPVGVIPLDKVKVLPPQGGRRVFQPHASTEARNGYEFVIIHQPIEGEATRPPAFLVAESNAKRETWIRALDLRSDVNKDTRLRNVGGSRMDSADNTRPTMDIGATAVARTRNRKARRRDKDGDDEEGAQEERDIEMAKEEFGLVEFSEEKYLNNFFQTNNDFEAGNKIDVLEQWQSSIKRGLRGAVLEQYEYFVEASREMTTMGKEVTALKGMVETQSDMIKEMKNLDFTAAFGDGDHGSLASDEEDLLENPDAGGKSGRKRGRRRAKAKNKSHDDVSVASSLSSDDEEAKTKGKKNLKSKDDIDHETEIEIPSWLDDVGEEISAFIKESRYTDATDLLFKARTEVNDILAQHDRPTDSKLSKKQHANMNNTLHTLDKLAEKMSSRLVEGLRRKNEALKQAGKRERSDPLSLMAPMVSPCCLGDDSIPLHLLVKLGKTQEAATAYAARRSLLLLESLHERPISGTGNVDLVIYAAQLSQSFFSCLAGAVEGFLDLFLVAAGKDPDGADDASSLLTNATRNVPPGALASIVLWCDSELSKFSSAFGGTRILGNLALSPPPRQESTSKARMVGFEDEGNLSMKERQHAIEVAAQCVGQAFQYASENLDSIGLPLTPRLAEYIRSRLKGCESEVSKKLDDRWKHITFEWEIELDQEDLPMDERASRR